MSWARAACIPVERGSPLAPPPARWPAREGAAGMRIGSEGGGRDVAWQRCSVLTRAQVISSPSLRLSEIGSLPFSKRFHKVDVFFWRDPGVLQGFNGPGIV